MSSISFPKRLLVVAVALNLIWIAISAAWLPERVATHFNGEGVPNGFMTRNVCIAFMVGLTIGLPGFLVLLSTWIIRIPGISINIPHRDYWLTPERREQTFNAIDTMLAYLACGMVMFLGVIHTSVVHANQSTPTRLASSFIIVAIVPFFAFVIGFVVAIYRRFGTVPQPMQ